MFYGTPFLTGTTRKFEPHVGRHVPLFTSSDKFEARRNNITTLQDSQDEISELTSKFRNPPLVTLNCNDIPTVVVVQV